MAETEENKSFEEMSFEEISNMSNEAFMGQMARQRTYYLDNLTDIGDPNYKSYTREQKINFWETALNRQMRRQVESGLSEYIIFSADWHRAIKKIEPEFDNIVLEVFRRPGFSEWKFEEYKRHIED